jgi:hypothetical protein
MSSRAANHIVSLDHVAASLAVESPALDKICSAAKKPCSGLDLDPCKRADLDRTGQGVPRSNCSSKEKRARPSEAVKFDIAGSERGCQEAVEKGFFLRVVSPGSQGFAPAVSLDSWVR